MWEKVKKLLGWLFGTKDPDATGITEEELAAERSRADQAELEADKLRGRLEAVLADAERQEKLLQAAQAVVDRYFT